MVFLPFIFDFHYFQASHDTLPAPLKFLDDSNKSVKIGFECDVLVEDFDFFRDFHEIDHLFEKFVSF